MLFDAPYARAVAVEVGKSVTSIVPFVMEEALIAIAAVATLVIRPYISTATTGILLPVPYVPAVTPDVGRRNADIVPVVIMDALSVDDDADVTRP